MHGTEEKMKNFNMMKKLLALTLGAAMLLAVMTFDQRVYNQPYLGGRNSGDILLIRELPESTEGGKGE